MKLSTFWRLLKANARRKAEARGHSLHNFVTTSRLGASYTLVATSRCTKCRMPVVLHSERPHMAGAALDLDCARPEILPGPDDLRAAIAQMSAMAEDD